MDIKSRYLSILLYREICKSLPVAHFTCAREHIAIPTLPSFSPYNLIYWSKILHNDRKSQESVNNQNQNLMQLKHISWRYVTS